MRRNKQTEVPESPSWDDIFKNVPTAPGTEAQQARHKELRQTRGDEMTEVEEQELNNLFRAIATSGIFCSFLSCISWQ